MRFWVDAWDPAYVTVPRSGDADGNGPTRDSTAEPDTDVEVPAAAWAPLRPPPDLRAPDHVLLVDGVRRTDATIWTAEPDGGSFPGLAGSYAAGVVRCDLRRGHATVVETMVERALFTASPTATDVDCGQFRYSVHRTEARELAQLSGAAQAPLTQLEVTVSRAARQAEEDRGDLLVVDGPLRGRTDLPRTIGYIKTQQGRYLPAELEPVVTQLAPGQRTPIVRLGPRWDRYTWYLRLPGGSGAPWSAIARVECAPELTTTAAVRLADLSMVTLPRFAATAYKDPRAPQNLVPIAGLEQRLRARLGDPRLLHRALVSAGRPAAPTGRRDG